MLSIDVVKKLKRGQSVRLSISNESFYALITDITEEKVSLISESGTKYSLAFSDMGTVWEAEAIPAFTDVDGVGYTRTSDVLKMLKDMQLSAAKCTGFIVGMVTQAWVISELLGPAIQKLGGKPYVIKNGKLYDSEED